MALNPNHQVPLPERGIIKYKSKNTTYVYHITRIYRNEKGRPTNDRVSIGKIDNETGMLIPNKNYYDIYSSSNSKLSQPEIESIKSCGVTYVVDGLLNELGLIDIMKKKFPKNADQIIALAEYMLCEGNVMSYYGDWFDEVYPHGNVKLGSADISRVFQAINYKSRMDFFKTWIYARNPSEYIAYDVTSVSSYAKGIEALEWGYNRDKESLSQLNFAMYYGQQSMLPLYYCMYPGSVPDKVHLEYMLRDNELIGCKRTKYVMDRGFFTADNLRLMTEAGTRFIISYDRYFKINRSKDGGVGFIRDSEKINAIILRLGFFIIIETDFEASSLEVLMTYRQRDVVEKSFDDLKNELDMKRLHCHTDETTEGKMFIAFFALILRSCMQNKLRAHMNESGLTFSSVLKELRKIKYVHTCDGKKLLSAITKKQRDIFNACELSTDSLPGWLSSITV